ncbi:helix-turn-helix transcriptional regulator [Pseudonocardia broussonetiae]|uniref:Helix-turn-helix domain-containing protein n=1 Tax=Pseudonocardia broussonetiae TaxID=2736640 RepID=A0A6M6JQY9_9PSEU|nr:helix-turn-helix domain-containing protein [Pseudonocardia broussonetiae]QJY49052.1 helix-turn-helix domain-containing protein [Pseudonocardia broussonetiae]
MKIHDTWFTTEELADLLGVDPSSVRRWRTATPPEGPPFVRVSTRHTIYARTDIEAWLEQHRTDPGNAA